MPAAISSLSQFSISSVAPIALLDEPHVCPPVIVPGSVQGARRERNQGLLGVSSGQRRALPDTPKSGLDLRFQQIFALEAATGIEPVYRALQAAPTGSVSVR